MHNLIFTRPYDQRIGQHFVNLTGYHGPGHSELFYETDGLAARKVIAGIVSRYQLTHWYTMPRDLWLTEATNYFTKAPWDGGVMSKEWKNEAN